MTASIPFHWWFMNNLAGLSVCPGPHTATQLHRRDELMNSELDGVKLGMTWWSVPVIRSVAKLEIDDFIRLWLSSAITINHRGPQVSHLPWYWSAGMLVLYMLMCVTLSFVSAATDSSLTRAAQSLEKEVQEVKATLQTMLAQLKEEEEEEEEVSELQDDDLVQNGTEEDEEEEEEEEDQYFSDSWGIWNGCL